MAIWYAHSLEDAPCEMWQLLSSHLLGVASLSRKFAESLGYGIWGEQLGLLHDIGKACLGFQNRLNGSSERVDHAAPGARIALDRFVRDDSGDIAGWISAFVVAGHHGGMPNGIGAYSVEGEDSTRFRMPLESRLKHVDATSYCEVLEDLGIQLAEPEELEALPFLKRNPAVSHDDRFVKSAIFSLSMLSRMLLSCLVDADYLDTERFASPDVAAVRQTADESSFDCLYRQLEQYMRALQDDATDSLVNHARSSVLRDCIDAASWDPGLFTLTVPTGGGKTLSSLAFALRHAALHGKRRVIYAIPYTSIVEQTAAVFRSVLGNASVLEHHSNYDFTTSEEDRRARLAIQNWDAPVIVTTNVQLFESLFSNRPGKCRKVHNIANSVIVLDEAQTLPDELLLSTLAALECLCLDFGTSVAMCTATQPALRDIWPFGAKPREIIQYRAGFEEAFGRRARFENMGPIDERKLIKDLSAEFQALCIVGTKPKARRVYESVRGEFRGEEDRSIFHLSANMTPAHRADVLLAVRRRLSAGERCVVISTQLIEAGVDISFPVVYREIAGIDSLFQAAGRCNREGECDQGRVKVFEFEEDSRARRPQNWLERMKAIAKNEIEHNGGRINEGLIEPFFAMRYETGETDAKGIFHMLTARSLISSSLKTLKLETVAKLYRIIEDDTKPVFVPFGEEGVRLLNRLERAVGHGEAPASLAMALQRSSVSVRTELFERLVSEGILDTATYAPINVLSCDMGGSTYYSEEVGLLEPGKEELNALVF